MQQAATASHDFKNIHVTQNPLNAAYDEVQAKLNSSQVHPTHGNGALLADSGQGSGHGSGFSIPTPPMSLNQQHQQHGTEFGNGTHIIRQGGAARSDSGTSIINIAQKTHTLHRHSTLREK